MSATSPFSDRSSTQYTPTSSRTRSSRASKSSSATTETSIVEMPSQSKRRSGGKRSKESSKVPMVDAVESENEDKRSTFKKRNRIAASKSREKKKQYVSDLEGTKIELETNHIRLQIEHKGLLDEVSFLKHHLMSHGHCNDSNINKWLTNEARRFVETSSSTQSTSSHSSSPSLDSPGYGSYGGPGWSEQDLSNMANQADMVLGDQKNMDFSPVIRSPTQALSASDMAFRSTKGDPIMAEDYMPDGIF